MNVQQIHQVMVWEKSRARETEKFKWKNQMEQKFRFQWHPVALI